MNTIWAISILLVLFTILLIVLLHYNNMVLDNNYKYLAGAVGLAGFTFAIFADGLFVNK